MTAREKDLQRQLEEAREEIAAMRTREARGCVVCGLRLTPAGPRAVPRTPDLEHP